MSLNNLLLTKNPVEIVEPSLPKKSSRSTCFCGSLNEESNYLCEQSLVMQTECLSLCRGSAGKPCKNNELQNCSFNYRTTEHPLVKVRSAGVKEKVSVRKIRSKREHLLLNMLEKYLKKMILRRKSEITSCKSGMYSWMRKDAIHMPLQSIMAVNQIALLSSGRLMVDGKMRAEIITNKDIVKGTELWIDYKWNRGDTICHCGAKKCRIYL